MTVGHRIEAAGVDRFDFVQGEFRLGRLYGGTPPRAIVWCNRPVQLLGAIPHYLRAAGLTTSVAADAPFTGTGGTSAVGRFTSPSFLRSSVSMLVKVSRCSFRNCRT